MGHAFAQQGCSLFNALGVFVSAANKDVRFVFFRFEQSVCRSERSLWSCGDYITHAATRQWGEYQGREANQVLSRKR